MKSISKSSNQKKYILLSTVIISATLTIGLIYYSTSKKETSLDYPPTEQTKEDENQKKSIESRQSDQKQEIPSKYKDESIQTKNPTAISPSNNLTITTLNSDNNQITLRSIVDTILPGKCNATFTKNNVQPISIDFDSRGSDGPKFCDKVIPLNLFPIGDTWHLRLTFKSENVQSAVENTIKINK